MTKTTRNSRLSKLLEIPLPLLPPALPEAFDDLRMSVDRFCLLAGVETLGEMLDEDSEVLCGARTPARPSGRAIAGGQPRARLPITGAR